MRPAAIFLASIFLLPFALASESYERSGGWTVTCGAQVAGTTGVFCGASWCVTAPGESGTYRLVLRWEATAPGYDTIRLNVTTLDASGARNGPNVAVIGPSPLVVSFASHASDEKVCPAFQPGGMVSADPALSQQAFKYRLGLE